VVQRESRSVEEVLSDLAKYSDFEFYTTFREGHLGYHWEEDSDNLRMLLQVYEEFKVLYQEDVWVHILKESYSVIYYMDYFKQRELKYLFENYGRWCGGGDDSALEGFNSLIPRAKATLGMLHDSVKGVVENYPRTPEERQRYIHEIDPHIGVETGEDVQVLARLIEGKEFESKAFILLHKYVLKDFFKKSMIPIRRLEDLLNKLKEKSKYHTYFFNVKRWRRDKFIDGSEIKFELEYWSSVAKIGVWLV